MLDPLWDVFYTDVDYRGCACGYIRSMGLDLRPDDNSKTLDYYIERINRADDIMEVRSRFGTHSMIISKNGIEKIYEHFTTKPLWTAVDIDIHYIQGIRQYSSRRDIVSNLRESSSDTLPRCAQ